MIHTFIRAHRKQCSISQQDLADLLELPRAVIDDTERGQRRPTLELAFGLQVVFGAMPSSFFPVQYSRIEERLMRRAKERYDALEGKTDRRSEHLRALFDRMASHSLIQGASQPKA